MHCLPARAAALFLACGLALVPLAAAQAQDDYLEEWKPVAVSSTVSVNELLDDLAWVAKAAGFEEEWGSVEQMAPMYLGGLNWDKPMGSLGWIDDADITKMRTLGFVPVDDIEPLLDLYEQFMGERLEPDDDGVYTLTSPTGEETYAKLENGFLFFTNKLAMLEELPEDPVALLGDLPERYTSGSQLRILNVPEEVRQEFYDEMRESFEEGFEEGLDQALEGADIDSDLSEEVRRQQFDAFMEGIEASESLAFGLEIDHEVGTMYFDVSYQAIEGTEMAEWFEGMYGLTSEHTGFLLPDAAVSLLFAGELSEESIDSVLALLKEAKQEALEKAAEQEYDDEAAREAALASAEAFFDIANETIREGKIDAGGVVVLEPESMTFAMGGRVADGNRLSELVEELNESLSEKAEEENVELDEFDHEGVHFHTVIASLEEHDSAETFGDEIEVVVAYGEESVYFAFGTDAIEVLKTVVESSQAAGEVETAPFQLSVALAPIMTFAASQAETPILSDLALEMQGLAGRDQILVSTTIIDRGMNFRIELEEGVITAIGSGIRQAMQPTEVGGP